ncbi:MAG TPA: hypothetical protein VMS17_23980 [Gemmataceae bacterium]|nr:hypothetical protein [Gemmataceae bacterium]
MTRRKLNEQGDDLNNPAEQQAPLAEGEIAADAAEATQERKSTWLARFPAWTDVEAGVHLVEDRQNRRLIIKFDDKPSKEVRAVMKAPQYGWRFDDEDVVWHKKIGQAKERQSHHEAEALALRVANMIREEKGLEPKKAFALGV